MIPIDIEDPVVLRRALEDLESKITVLATPVTPINDLVEAPDLDAVSIKVSEIVSGLNAVITALNLTNTSDKP